ASCRAGSQVRAGEPARQRSGVLALGVLEPEERALPAVLALLLVEEVELPLVERAEPLLPGDVAQLVGPLAEVEPQDAGPVPVLGALDRRGHAVPRLGPVPDDLVTRRH